MTTSPASPQRSERSLLSEQKFFALITEMGATLAPGAAYVNSRTSVELICSQGHVCFPTPDSILRGNGVCRVCSQGKGGAARKAKGQAAFLTAVAARGATLAPGSQYVNSFTKVHLICSQGHACSLTLDGVRLGLATCYTCAGTPSSSARDRFLALIAGMEATLAPGASYVNSSTPVSLICANGHACSPRPSNVLAGHGICRVCPKPALTNLLGEIDA